MAEGHRVRIGSDIRFFEKTDDKPATAYARLAEDQWGRNEAGELVQGETLWYDGVFEGREAIALNESFQSGDALVVIGNARDYTNDKGYETTRLYANTFGPDAARMTVAIDRSPRETKQARQEQRQEATQETAQEADQQARDQPAQQDAAAEMMEWQKTEEILRERVGQLIHTQRLTEAQANQIGGAWEQAKSTGSPGESDQIMQAELEKAGLGIAEREYLSSVTASHDGTSQVKTWEQAESAAQWAQLDAARQAARAPEPAPPAPAAAPSM